MSDCEKQGVSIVSMHSPGLLYASKDDAHRKNAVAEGVVAAEVAEEMGAAVMVCHFQTEEQSEKSVTDSQSNELTQQRSQVENELILARASTSASMDLEWLEKRLPDAAKQIRRWVMNAGADDMRLILSALDIQVRASRHEVEIEGVLPVPEPQTQDLVTIVQTSA